MSFQSLERILGSIQEQSRWQEQPFQIVLKCWAEVVGAVVATHTRPLSIQRQVLWVATSSAVWAQELTFGRQRILTKLNVHLPSPMLDIRFSGAGWQRPQNSRLSCGDPVKTNLACTHPSWVVTSNSTSSKKTSYNSPKDAFRDWAMLMQARSRQLPLCPQCHCPTPEGELERWKVCSICAAKQW